MSREKKDTDYEQVGQTPVCRIVKEVIFFMSEQKASGTVDDVKFTVDNNLDGSMVINFGDKLSDRYIINVREAVEEAYADYKHRKGL